MLHWIALLVFGLLSIAPFRVVVITVIGISVIAAIIKIPSLLVMAGIVTAVSILFPPLTLILSIIFFLMKISYIINHYKALLFGAGLITYLIYISINNYYADYFWSALRFGYYLPTPLIQRTVLQMVVSMLIIHLLLYFLYRNKYTTKEALIIMSTVPLFLLLLILPFILNQLEELKDFLDTDTFDEFEENQMGSTTYNPNPELHTVEGHYRTNSDGSVSYVRPHVRTNPDGFKSNNLR
ncbi:hypothetical protein J2T56_001398 [Natronobacillus azotifigens]|uniref:Uncharacterized protein n=1 Tax=Natronobacillus azotifigens TaxID=472978 RepID=A0A9J6RCY7_9BACI|nr:hypothetical protein [Natronobacillus azotifigens]MCZ0703164.1 hypothetical protein [Natronobacillus azotifigens]